MAPCPQGAIFYSRALCLGIRVPLDMSDDGPSERGAFMSTYAISDIHGCFDRFMAVLELAEFDPADDELYVLGDIVDRGKQIDLCAKWLVDNKANAEDSPIHFLMGNHEEMATWTFEGAWSHFKLNDINLVPWEINGGRKTFEQLQKLDLEIVDAFQRIASKAPKAVKLHIDDRLILLCHAGIRPAEPESEDAEWLIQAEEDLLWIGFDWYCASEQAPFDVVSGHVPTVRLQREENLPGCPDDVRAAGAAALMMHWGCRHDIDCGCVYGGKMGLLRLDDWREFYA